MAFADFFVSEDLVSETLLLLWFFCVFAVCFADSFLFLLLLPLPFWLTFVSSSQFFPAIWCVVPPPLLCVSHFHRACGSTWCFSVRLCVVSSFFGVAVYFLLLLLLLSPVCCGLSWCLLVAGVVIWFRGVVGAVCVVCCFLCVFVLVVWLCGSVRDFVVWCCWWVLLLVGVVCVVVSFVLVVWLCGLVRFCVAPGVWLVCVSCVASGCSCVWLFFCFFFCWFCFVLGCPLFCGPPGVGVAPVVFRVWLLFCLCCSLRCFWFVTIWLVCGPAPGLTQNATLVGWLLWCGVVVFSQWFLVGFCCLLRICPCSSWVVHRRFLRFALFSLCCCLFLGFFLVLFLVHPASLPPSCFFLVGSLRRWLVRCPFLLPLASVLLVRSGRFLLSLWLWTLLVVLSWLLLGYC